MKCNLELSGLDRIDLWSYNEDEVDLIITFHREDNETDEAFISRAREQSKGLATRQAEMVKMLEKENNCGT